MTRALRLALVAVALAAAATPAAAGPILPPVCENVPGAPEDVCLPPLIPHRCIPVPDLDGHVWQFCIG